MPIKRAKCLTRPPSQDFTEFSEEMHDGFANIETRLDPRQNERRAALSRSSAALEREAAKDNPRGGRVTRHVCHARRQVGRSTPVRFDVCKARPCGLWRAVMHGQFNFASGVHGHSVRLLQFPRFAGILRTLALLLGFAAMSGCALMPSSGPTSGQILKDASGRDKLGFRIVEVADIASAPGGPPIPAVFLPERYVPPTNLISPGDVLDIAVYESGVTLFGGAKTSAAAAATLGFDSTAQVERLPPVRVDDMGAIRLPYIGRIEVAGLTSSELEAKIRAGYKGMSQNPQIMVGIRDSIGNSVILSGEVARPGRLVLPTNTETLSDVLALAGGYRGDAKDLSVRVVRQDQTVELRLSDVMAHRDRDMRIYPADRIAIVRAPRTIAVMGAPGRVEQMAFSGPTISLAEALAQAGGSNPGAGNAAAVFVFRFEQGADGAEVPVAYHVNMMRASGYFVSQRFVMRDKDVLYIGNSEANQPSKVIGLVSQLFGPLVVLNSVIRN